MECLTPTAIEKAFLDNTSVVENRAGMAEASLVNDQLQTLGNYITLSKTDDERRGKPSKRLTS